MKHLSTCHQCRAPYFRRIAMQRPNFPLKDLCRLHRQISTNFHAENILRSVKSGSREPVTAEILSGGAARHISAESMPGAILYFPLRKISKKKNRCNSKHHNIFPKHRTQIYVAVNSVVVAIQSCQWQIYAANCNNNPLRRSNNYGLKKFPYPH